ncbi:MULTISPECIES: efflux RND transporter permease subunit [unclassified Thioalkalivibrio]|uniref:efflux RND transporter permease subunit n=1 Tax=unclassified Thioalkalivibrio TaxID=2621013 RepID=UPI000361987F|nr:MULTISPECIES: efflux RND transporter permease subunit [unclassified Thioalkalivibrio]
MTWVEGLLRYRHTVLALLAAALILGLQARFDLPVQLFPDTDPPTVTVITEYPGMAALDVDRELTRLLEEEFASLDGVTRIRSSSQTGLSVARVEFDYGITSALAAVDVQNAVGRLRPDLPATIEEPQILEFSTADKPIVTIALTSDTLALDAIREQADNAIRERLEWIPGVAAIDVVGGHKRELHVALDPERTEALGIDMSRVLEALDDWNLMAPGGRVRIGELESVVRFDAPLRSEADARGIILIADGDTRVRLGDLARVRLEPGEPRSAYRHDGRAAIAVQVLRRDDANTVEVAARVREALGPLRDAAPELDIVVADDDSVFTEKVIADMTQTVMIAIALTMVIVLLFLADLRQAGIIALSIPAAFLATFGLMQLAGLDLNMVTMSALILAIGLLVDDGIVILENIHRHLDEEGQPPRQAAIEGVGEVFGAKLGGTLTTLGVLLPLTFMGGFVGELFRPLALTLAFALGASFVMAVTLIPLLATYWLRPATATATPRWRETLEAPARGVRHLYLDVLALALKRPLATLAVAVMLLALSLGMLRMTGSEMLPRFDSGSFQVLVDLAPGTRLDTTLATLEPVEQYLAEHEYVVDVSGQFGHEAGARSMGDRGAMGVNQAEITVTLLPRTQRSLTQWEIMDDVRQRLEATPGVTLAVPRELGGTARSSTAAPIIARISGEQAQTLDRTASELLDHLAGIPGITDLYKDWALDTPEVRVRVDHDRAAELGLTGAGLARAVHQAMDGAVATRFRQPPKRDLDVLGFHLGRPLSEVVADVQQRLDSFTAPDGYPATLAGEQADFDEARDHMMRALLLAALAVYLLLVVQFRSFAHPVIIMTAIPLQFIGVVAALLIAGKYVSMPALLGIILLIGIVVNNSIILLDLARRRLAEGRDIYAAVTEAVETRMRPIMMTALSTIAGMLPLALEMAVGAERFSPIATVIIGGILAATVLTLVVIPALFVILHRFGPAPAKG